MQTLYVQAIQIKDNLKIEKRKFLDQINELAKHKPKEKKKKRKLRQ